MTTTPLATLRGTRIAHLIETDGPGGAERVMAYLASAMQAAGCPGVAFLPAGHDGWLSRELSRAGIWIEYYRLDRPFSPSFVQWLADAFRQYQIGVAHSHEFSMAVYGSWAARRSGIGHLITMHGSRYYAQRMRRRVALRTAAMLSGGVVAVSRELGRHLARDLWLPRSKVLMVTNGVPTVPRGSSRLREELGIAAADPIVLSIGRLSPVKGHAVLLDAFARLSTRHPRARLVLAGPGPLAETLTRQAADLGIAERFYLLGLRTDIANILAAADVFVLPSLSEGLPMALLEAMNAGVPSVATDVGEVRDVLAGGDAGRIVPPGDPAALAAAIDGLLADQPGSVAMVALAGQRVAARYSLASMIERYAELYQERLPSAVLV